MGNRNNQTNRCQQVLTCNGETKTCGAEARELRLFLTHYECTMCGSEWQTEAQAKRDAAES